MTVAPSMRRTLLLASAASLLGLPAVAADFNVAPGVTDTVQKVVAGTDTGVVQAGGVLSSATNPAINWNGTSTSLSITNSGTIRSTAADGRAINAGGGNNVRNILLTNNASGIIESQNDAIRINVDPTGGTIRVDNYGIIRTTLGGQALDFDAAASGAATIIINNYQGGQLIGIGQDAIRPGQGAVVTNAGLIRSDMAAVYDNFDGIDWQNKSGVVINQATGVISGFRHGITSDVSVNVTNEAGGVIEGRNGSGVGSDGVGSVINRGRISGKISNLSPNGDGDGVDIDGVGSIENYGVIEGLGAVGVDSGGNINGSDGIAMGGGVINNYAGATISGLTKAILIDDGADGGALGVTTILNQGVITGGGEGGVILRGTFNDVLTNSGAISATGTGKAIDMGAGNDTLNLSTGSVITGLTDGGAGTDVLNLAGTGTLAATANFETLNLGANAAWALTGAQTYGSAVLAAGSRLSGLANVTNLTVSGTLAPGNSIGTTNVAGNLIMNAGAVYEVEVNAAGATDLVAVTGTAALNGSVSVLAGTGTYNNVTTYTILTTAGGRTGTFTGVTTNLAFLTPHLAYTANAVTLSLHRNDVAFQAIAATPNQTAVATVVTTFGAGNALYDALLPLSADTARISLDLMAGDLHGTVRGALFEGGRHVRTAALDRAAQDGAGAWGTVYDASSNVVADGGFAASDEGRGGVLFGVDRMVGDWRLGVIGGASKEDVEQPGRDSVGEIKGGEFGAYAIGKAGPVSLRFSVNGGQYEVRTTRGFATVGLANTLTSTYDASTWQVFGEVAKAFGSETLAYEPFVNVAWESVDTDAFAEAGGAAALSAAARDSNTTYATAGIRVRGQTELGGLAVQPRLSLAYRHGDGVAEASQALLQFASGGPAFTIDGAGRDEDATLLEFGVDAPLGKNARASLMLTGVYSELQNDNGVRFGVSWGF